jgi:hypothetical protein
MDLYGIDNVRGGSYSTIILGKNVKEILKKELLTASDKCYKYNKT